MSGRPIICWCPLCDELVTRDDLAWPDGSTRGQRDYAHVSCIAKRDVREIVNKISARRKAPEPINLQGGGE